MKKSRLSVSGQAQLILSFDSYIRRRGRTIVPNLRELRLPQIPEAPLGTHRQQQTPAMRPARPIGLCFNSANTGHTSPVPQDLLGPWRVGLETRPDCSPTRVESDQAGTPE